MKTENAAWLEGVSGEMVGLTFRLTEGETRLGRSEGSQLKIMDPMASRKHALIRFSAGGCVIEDLGSKSGTFVNGSAVQSADLNDGDTITIGETVFRFRYGPGIESEPAATAVGSTAETVMAVPERQDADWGESQCGQCGAVLGADDELCAECGAARSGDEIAHLEDAAPADTVRAVDVPPPAPPTRRAGAEPEAPFPRAALPPTPPAPPPPPPPSKPASRGIPWKWVAIVGGGFAVLAMAIAATILVFGFFSVEEPGSVIAVADPTNTKSGTIIETTAMVVPTAISTPLIPPTITPTVDIVELPTPPQSAVPSPASPTVGGASQIAFASDRGGRPQIYLVNVDGSGERQLTDLEGGACQPAWSPDGAQLAYTSPCSRNSEEYPGASVYILPVDPQGIPYEPSPLAVTLGGGDYDPDWSYDGLRLAFTSWQTGRPQIFTIGADGNGLKNVNDDLAFNWSPSWAPDGSQLAILTGRGGQEEIWLVPDVGGEETRYTHSDGKDISRPDWSPDGAMILFEKVVGNIPRLVAAPIAGGGVREIQICQEGLLSLRPMGEPAWSPDGQWIAFETWPDGVNHNIGIMRASCTDYLELTIDPALDFDAAWRPAN